MFTTNLMPDNLDPRVASRLLDQRVGKVFEIVAPDYRTEMTAPAQPPAAAPPRPPPRQRRLRVGIR